MPKLMLLSLEHIRTKEKKKGRGGICPHRVREFASAIECGDDIPPIRVNALGDGTFVVKEGRHRVLAHRMAGMTQIWAIVENIIRRLFRKWRSLAFGHLFCGWLSFCLIYLPLCRIPRDHYCPYRQPHEIPLAPWD